MSRPCNNCGADLRVCVDCDLYKGKYYEVEDVAELLGKVKNICLKVKHDTDNCWHIDDIIEEIDTINPGVQGQTVLIKIPYKVEKNWVIRHKKNK